MAMSRTIAAFLGALLLGGGAQGQTSRPADDAGASLMADSFRASAVEATCLPASTVGRAGRLVALCRMADRLALCDASTNILLSDICYARKEPVQEAAALENYLKSNPGDHARWVRLVTAKVGALNTAQERIDLLKTLSDRQDMPASARAAAFTLVGGVFHNQGKGDEALALVDQALKLDAHCPAALRLRAALRPNATPPERLETHLRLLRGDCRSWADAVYAALNLSLAGLHEQALDFYEHAWQAAQSQAGKAPPELATAYCNALMDAGKPDKAIEIFGGASGERKGVSDLTMLLIEAYQAENKETRAGDLVLAMAQTYADRKRAGEFTIALEAEQAWFSLVFQNRPEQARPHIELAIKGDPGNAVYQRISGVTDLLSGAREQGRKTLEPMAEKDLYAALYLAKDYVAAGDKEGAKRFLLAAAKQSRSGPAWRQVAQLAGKTKVDLPASEHRDAMADALKHFDMRYLAASRQPENFLSATIVPAKASLSAGEPLDIEAVIKNIGVIELPIGGDGLLQPTMAFIVGFVGDASGVAASSFSELPMAVWPAPRYLASGASLKCRVRLDVAALADKLVRNSIDDTSLIVQGIVDPRVAGAGVSVGLKVEPVRIMRGGLLSGLAGRSEDRPMAYKRLLGSLVGDLRRGDVARRMLAARRVASLLALARDIDLGRARPPEGLSQSIDKRVLLSMLQAFLRDPSPAVRQEMVAALRPVELDDTMIGLLAPAVNDESPAVRMRVVELLVSKQTEGCESLLKAFAQDKHDLVRDMARSMTP
jgi:tetratricopeptide (TPR) repeat protein